MKYWAHSEKIVVLILFLISLTADGAPAQGTNQAYPDPVDSRTLESWLMERFSGEGDGARTTLWGPCLDAYQARYRGVRLSEIESWLADHRAQDKNEADGMEKLTRRRRAILKTLADLDESLASELTRVLSLDDSFRARISNRLARRRALSVCRQLGRGRIRTDLIDEVEAVEPPDEAMAALAPQLMAWDVETRRALDDITQSMLDLAVEKAARGLGTFHPGFGLEGGAGTSEFDPASVDSWMKWNEARNRLLDKRHDSLDAIARRTIEIARSMKTVLTEEQYDRLMESVLPKLYGPYLSGRSDLPWLFRQARAELDPIEQAYVGGLGKDRGGKVTQTEWLPRTSE